MPLLNFKAQFADDVEAGEKTRSIRALRVDGHDPKPGDTLYLWTGCRTKRTRKLGEATCIAVRTIVMGGRSKRGKWRVYLEGPRGGANRLTHAELCEMAHADGFVRVADFEHFFRQQHGLPFKGLLIEWELN